MIPDSVKEKWKIKEKSSGVRFRTFHVLGKEKGSVTAVTVPLDKEHTEFLAQFSYLSPKEEKGFCRQTAKDIALARFNGKKVFGIKLKSDQKLKDALKSVIVLQANKKDIHWLEGVIESDLV